MEILLLAQKVFSYPLSNETISKRNETKRIDRWKVGEQSAVKAELESGVGGGGRRQRGKTLGSAESGLGGGGEGGGKREREESTPKIGSNKLSTIFAGLNTLKRLEIRLAGGPFVHGVPCRPGMKDCNVLSREQG